MVRRVAAAQATLDRFRDRPFAWGRHDCARMVSYHMRQMGHALPVARAGSYSTALGAKRALRRMGVASIADLPAHYGLIEIPPAAAMVGDLMQLPAEDALGALAVAVGNGRVIGFHQDAIGATVMQPLIFERAWRVELLNV